MARRTILKILLPAMRFLTMVNALLGILLYEEKDGHYLTGRPHGNGEFIMPFEDGLRQAQFVDFAHLFPRPRESPVKHLDEAKETLEDELPEGESTHIAVLKAAGRRRNKKKNVQTPLGIFTITSLMEPWRNLLAAV